MAGRKVVIGPGNRAYDPGTGQAIGYRPGETSSEGNNPPQSLDLSKVNQPTQTPEPKQLRNPINPSPGVLAKQNYTSNNQTQQPTPSTNLLPLLSVLSPQVSGAYDKAVATVQNPVTEIAKAGIETGIAVVGGTVFQKIWKGTKTVQTVNNAFKIGDKGRTLYDLTKGGASQYATNTATQATTMQLLAKVGVSITLGGLLVGAIGSYPFSGFLNEEASQTLSYASNSATENNDFDGADKALKAQRELLNPSTTSKILSLIPYKNVMISLNNFFDASRTKVEIDQKVNDDKRKAFDEAQKNGGDPDQIFWTNYQKEKEDFETKSREQKLTDEKAYNENRIKTEKEILRLKAEARTAEDNERVKQREADALFWLDYQKKKAELDEIERQKEADFWIKYREYVLKMQAENGQSRLNFRFL